MVKFKIEWSLEARLDLLDILDFYVTRNKSTIYTIARNYIQKFIRALSLSLNNHTLVLKQGLKLFEP